MVIALHPLIRLDRIANLVSSPLGGEHWAKIVILGYPHAYRNPNLVDWDVGRKLTGEWISFIVVLEAIFDGRLGKVVRVLKADGRLIIGDEGLSEDADESETEHASEPHICLRVEVVPAHMVPVDEPKGISYQLIIIDGVLEAGSTGTGYLSAGSEHASVADVVVVPLPGLCVGHSSEGLSGSIAVADIVYFGRVCELFNIVNHGRDVILSLFNIRPVPELVVVVFPVKGKVGTGVFVPSVVSEPAVVAVFTDSMSGAPKRLDPVVGLTSQTVHHQYRRLPLASLLSTFILGSRNVKELQDIAVCGRDGVR